MNFFKGRKKIIITLALFLGIFSVFGNGEKVKADSYGGKTPVSFGDLKYNSDQKKWENVGSSDSSVYRTIIGDGFTDGSLGNIVRSSKLPSGFYKGNPWDAEISPLSQEDTSIEFHDGSTNSFMVSPDGVITATRGNNQTLIINRLTGDELQIRNFLNVTDTELPSVYNDVQRSLKGNEGGDFIRFTDAQKSARLGTTGVETTSTFNQEQIDRLTAANQALEAQRDSLDPESDSGKINEINETIASNNTKIASAKNNISTINNTLSSNKSVVINNGECGFTALGNCIKQVAFYILQLFAWLVGLAGWILNTIIQYTVVDIKANLEGITAINTGWTAIRDLVNILFIFILLYIAISTILGIDEHGAKHALAKVIIFGVLINFSMFFTKVIIDTSNIFTLQFYSKIRQTNTNQGLGGDILAAFNTPGIYSVSSSNDSARNFAASTQNATVAFVMGIIMILTAIGVIVGISWIFIKRFIVFIFLIISSPVAFAGMILHSTEHHTREWWSALIAEVVAAPALMIVLWLAFAIMGGGGTSSKTGLLGSMIGVKSSASGVGGIQTIQNATAENIFFNFVIVTALLSFAIVVAQKLGASGGDGAIKLAGGVRGAFKGMGGWGAKNTISAGAYNFLEKTGFGSRTLKQLRQHSNPLVRGFGRMTVGALQKLGEAHHHDVEEDKKAFEDTLNELRDDPEAKAKFLAKQMAGKAKLGGLIYPYNQKIAKYVTVGMKEDELATTALFMQDQGEQGKAASKTMLAYLSKEKQKAVQEMIDNRATKYHSLKVGAEAEKMGEYDRKQEEFDKTKKIKIDLGHGAEKIIEGREAQNHLDQLKKARAATQRAGVEKLKEIFNGFSDRQKTDIFGTLTRSEQLALARSDEFNEVLSNNLRTYQDAENARKSGLVKELGQKIMDTSYRKLSRIKIAHALSTGMDHTGKNPLDAATIAKLKFKWRELAPKTIDPKTGKVTGIMSVDDYKQSDERSADQTFSNADRNFSRMGEVSKEWTSLVEEMNKHGLDLNNLEVPRSK